MTDTKLHAEGTFPGKVTHAAHETSPFDDDGLVLAFTVELEDGSKCWPRHSLAPNPSNDNAKKATAITKRIVEEVFEQPWPDGVDRIDQAVGMDVTVRIKHNTRNGKTYANAYINPPVKGGEPAEREHVAKVVKALGGEATDNDVPF